MIQSVLLRVFQKFILLVSNSISTLTILMIIMYVIDIPNEALAISKYIDILAYAISMQIAIERAI